MATNPAPLRVLADTNVILDWLFERKPWMDEAQPLWDARSAGDVIMHVPASTLTDIFYIGRKLTNIPMAFTGIDRVFAAFNILPVNAQLLRNARTLPGNDFEDNVQIACAQAANIDPIVTRNTSDFAHAPIPTVEPPAITNYLPRP